MDIRIEQAKSAIMEYVEETFSGLEFNMSNVGSLMIAKIMVDRKFDSLVSLITDEHNLISVDLLEKYGNEAMSKLGSIEIPKLGGKLLFKQDDFYRLISKLKSKGEM